jgi:hypothetical protein
MNKNSVDNALNKLWLNIKLIIQNIVSTLTAMKERQMMEEET